MNFENLTSGEYVKKDDVLLYLKVYDWNMSREDLIEKFQEIATINLTEQDIEKIKLAKLLSGELK